MVGTPRRVAEVREKDGALNTTLVITTVTRSGTAPGDFRETSNCGSSRKAGWDCTITATFKPTATGARTATLNNKDVVGTQMEQLSGTGKEGRFGRAALAQPIRRGLGHADHTAHPHRRRCRACWTQG